MSCSGLRSCHHQKRKLWENLEVLPLEAIMPTCLECGIKMAIHQDDPPWDIFGLPRLLVDAQSIDRFLSMVDDPYNCLTLCTGSLNQTPTTTVPRSYQHCEAALPLVTSTASTTSPDGDFSRAAHRDCCGETGIIEVLRAYHDCGFGATSVPTTAVSCGRKAPATPRPGYSKYEPCSGHSVHAGCLGSAGSSG